MIKTNTLSCYNDSNLTIEHKSKLILLILNIFLNEEIVNYLTYFSKTIELNVISNSNLEILQIFI